ncbi:MAG: DoxX family protein [Fulvivirga sp.]
MKPNPDIGIFLLRLFIGLRLIYGVIDNIISWNHMVEFSKFLATHGFPMPLASAVVSVYVQFIGALLVLVGYKTRVAALVLVINFIVALFAVHIPINDTIEGMTPAMAMLFGCLTLFFTGPGKTSLD